MPVSDPLARLPLRVALLTNCLPPYRVSLFAALARRVQALRLLLSVPMEPNRSWPANASGLDVVVQRSLMLSTRRWRYREFGEESYLHFPVDTLAQLARFRPHAVISGELGLRTLLASLYTHLHPSSRLLIWLDLTEETESDVRPWRRLIRRLLLAGASAVITNGPSCSAYARSLGVPDDKLFLSPFSVPVDGFLHAAKLRTPAARTRLLFVGQLIERKGLRALHASLCSWCARQPGRRLELWFAGEGPLRAWLASQPRPANLDYLLLGDIAYEDLPKVYAQCGILVLPTYSDTWAMVVSEAMISGLPVLGSLHAQAVQFLVEDGRNGWTFRMDRPGQLDAALGRALDTPLETLDQMGLAARLAALAVTPDSSADAIAEALRSAAHLPCQSAAASCATLP